jgi:prevent-host-death family protein
MWKCGANGVISDQLIGQEYLMSTVTLADAKAKLSALVEQASQGEPVVITRRGKPVAQIVAVPAPRKPIDFEALRKMTDSMTMQTVSAGEFIRQMRDEGRY